LLNTVQMSPPITTFGERVASLLADSGYGIQTVDGDTGEFFVRYREEEISSELGVETSYVVAIGNVSVARSFDLSGGEDPRPVSPLFVAGAPEFDISLNDDVFAQVDADVSYALFDESTSPTVFDFDTQTAQVISDQSEGVTVTGVSTNNATPIQVAAPQVRVKENVFHLLESKCATATPYSQSGEPTASKKPSCLQASMTPRCSKRDAGQVNTTTPTGDQRGDLWLGGVVAELVGCRLARPGRC